ncbi:hypothetical protein K470DRAFT_263948 [Piedraia hortae CBS 480.64]|uniref:MYND-type domain-containing protein n=1 Tax=Piedraia hortae CBS 480.64 TaxID=1314780 RepID=A0A6A7C0U4_9PEZI|nr:hypothetical protein K470DRAFT_263948 [Piedraia hortae CBS 480.64]
MADESTPTPVMDDEHKGLKNYLSTFSHFHRQPKTLHGNDNRWVFAIRRTLLYPKAEFILAIHPKDKHAVLFGGTRIYLEWDDNERAFEASKLLLEAFCDQLGDNPALPKARPPLPMAPWTWAAEDHVLGEQMQSVLSSLPIPIELKTVHAATAEECLQLDNAWYRISMAEIVANSRGMVPALFWPWTNRVLCERCNEMEPSGVTFKTCSRCLGPRYCSKKCQTDDWRVHHFDCDTRGALKETLHYFTSRACRKPEALTLARKINIRLPTCSAEFKGFSLTINRLIRFNQDTPGNFALFFGPFWDEALQPLRENITIAISFGTREGSFRALKDYKMDPNAPLRKEFRVGPWELRMEKKLVDMFSCCASEELTWQEFKNILAFNEPNWESALNLYGILGDIMHPSDMPTLPWTRAMIPDE